MTHDLDQPATKRDLHDAIKNLATKDEIGILATKEEIGTLATKDEIGKLATKEEIGNLATREEIKKFATKDELKDQIEGLRTELTQKIDTVKVEITTELSQKMDEKFDNFKDQIIRAFRMTEGNIRKDCAHVDEVAAIDNRLSRVEVHVGLTE